MTRRSPSLAGPIGVACALLVSGCASTVDPVPSWLVPVSSEARRVEDQRMIARALEGPHVRRLHPPTQDEPLWMTTFVGAQSERLAALDVLGSDAPARMRFVDRRGRTCEYEVLARWVRPAPDPPGLAPDGHTLIGEIDLRFGLVGKPRPSPPFARLVLRGPLGDASSAPTASGTFDLFASDDGLTLEPRDDPGPPFSLDGSRPRGGESTVALGRRHDGPVGSGRWHAASPGEPFRGAYVPQNRN